jgi:beta-catenin-like protein 1
VWSCQRVKYGDDPSKFVDSELELFSEVEAFRAVAAAPHLYPDLVALNAVNSLLGT